MYIYWMKVDEVHTYNHKQYIGHDPRHLLNIHCLPSDPHQNMTNLRKVRNHISQPISRA
jgi:hypothetical protein